MKAVYTTAMIYNVSTERRTRSRAVATSKMEHFVIIVNGFQSLTIISKRFILDIAAALDPPLEHMVAHFSG